MANSAQAIKRVRQHAKRQQHNNHQRATTRSAVKKSRQAIRENTDDAKDTVMAAMRALDMAASKKLIHKNKAARLKKRLNHHLKLSQAT